jgi:hypothetical protein
MMAWHQTGTGEARAMQQWLCQRGDRGEGKWHGKGARQQLMQVGQRGCDGGTALK